MPGGTPDVDSLPGMRTLQRMEAFCRFMIRVMDFASVLAQRVAEVLPSGFTAIAEQGWVRVSHGDDYGTSTGVADIMGDSRESMASAAAAVLSSVQDYVSEELREPWPGGPGARKFFQPEVAVVGSTLRMWFGDRTRPTLAVTDIDLAELQ